MSLIQEALKRQQMENGDPAEGSVAQSPSAGSPAAPSAAQTAKMAVPPPARSAPTSPSPRKKSESGKKGSGGGGGKVGKVFLLFVLLGGIVWVAGKYSKPALEEFFPDMFADKPAPQEPGWGGGETKNVPATQVKPVVQDTPLAVAPAEKPQGTDTNGAGRKSVPVPVELVADDAAGKPIWPMLELNGIVGSGANGSCFINGNIVTVGETVQEVKIIEIRKNGVVLEYSGEQRFMRVGGSVQ